MKREKNLNLTTLYMMEENTKAKIHALDVAMDCLARFRPFEWNKEVDEWKMKQVLQIIQREKIKNERNLLSIRLDIQKRNLSVPDYGPDSLF